MNRHTVIAIIAIIVIIIPVVYSISNILGIHQTQYRWHGPDDFTFFAMSNHGEIEFCNTIPLWSSFQKFEISAFYDSEHIGEFVVGPTTMNPLSSTIQKGIFSSKEITTAQHFFMTLDFEFNGGDIRVDPNNLIILTNVETRIVGIIPYSHTTQISGFEFSKMMNKENLPCN